MIKVDLTKTELADTIYYLEKHSAVKGFQFLTGKSI